MIDIITVGLLIGSLILSVVNNRAHIKEIDRLNKYIDELQQTEKELMKMNENLQTKLYKK